MKTRQNPKSFNLFARLKRSGDEFPLVYRDLTGWRQPIHVVYGGAHLFKAETMQKLASIAQRALATYAPDAASLAQTFALSATLAEQVYERLQDKLAREPVEDYRLDFEDGYGVRGDAEEDAHAIAAAEQTVLAMEQNTMPPYFGLRCKALNEESRDRSARTLSVFLGVLCEKTNRRLPANFVITLPKVLAPEQVSLLAGLCLSTEQSYGLPEHSLQIELMIETPQALINERGEIPLPKLVAAAQGRCRGVHFGAFDYTAACGITASYQDIRHPACDFARSMMLTALSSTGVWLSDGVTTMLPMEPHRGGDLTAAQRAENQTSMQRAWKLHYDNIRHSLQSGFYQSWDLHPAQLIPRYVATYSFFLEGLDAATTRLRNFLDKAAQATTVGNVFDDAATGQGLLNYFVRAVHCGALDEGEAQTLTGLTMEELRSASFVKILQNRRK